MNKDDTLTQIEDELVEALEHLAKGQEVLDVTWHEALVATRGCILTALRDVIRLHEAGGAKAA